MPPDEIKETLIQVLRELQEKSGRQVPGEINHETCPVGDFEGFDSLNLAEAASEFTKRTDYQIPLKLLLGPTPDRPLTIEEMVNRLQHEICAQGGLP